MSSSSAASPPGGMSHYLSMSRQVLREQWPLILANTLEWYDAAVYGYVSSYLESNFFPSSFPIGVWLGYASTFLLRPVGGVAVGRLADRYMSRGQASLLAIGAMTIATVLQGCLPGKYCCGVVPARISLGFLILLRSIQGLSSGGEIAAVAVYLAEKSPLTALGLSTGIVSLGGNMGFCLGAGSNVVIQALLSQRMMEHWGWRIPFLLVAPIGAFILSKLSGKVLHGATSSGTAEQASSGDIDHGSEAFNGDDEFPADESSQLLGLPAQSKDSDHESDNNKVGDDKYLKARSFSHTPTTPILDGSGPDYDCDDQDKLPIARRETIWQLTAQFRLQLVLGALALAGISAHWYIAGVYIETFLHRRCNIPQEDASTSAFLVQATALVFVPLAAFLTDSLGVGKVMHLGAGLITILDWLILTAMATVFKGSSVLAYAGAIVLGIIQAIAGTTPYLLILELFPPRSRSLGLGCSYNISVAIFGGLGTVAASALVGSGCPSWTVGALISACGLISFVSIGLLRRFHTSGRIQTAHIRPQLY